MRIGEAARASGVTARSLRFYENEGLIVPGRCSNGYRDYCASTIRRVATIRSLRESGLPLGLIAEVLPRLVDDPAASDPLDAEFVTRVRQYRERLHARVAGLRAEIAGLDEFLARHEERNPT